MKRMEKPPIAARRGDVVSSGKRYFLPAPLIVEQIEYWNVQTAISDHARDVRHIMTEGLGFMKEIREGLDNPIRLRFDADELEYYQLVGGSILAASLFVQQPGTWASIEADTLSSSPDNPITGFDPGGSTLSWHVRLGYESNLIDVWKQEPDDPPETWYKGGIFYLRVGPSDPTAIFSESYREKFEGEKFPADQFRTITPVIDSAVLEPVIV